MKCTEYLMLMCYLLKPDKLKQLKVKDNLQTCICKVKTWNSQSSWNFVETKDTCIFLSRNLEFTSILWTDGRTATYAGWLMRDEKPFRHRCPDWGNIFATNVLLCFVNYTRWSKNVAHLSFLLSVLSFICTNKSNSATQVTRFNPQDFLKLQQWLFFSEQNI